MKKQVVISLVVITLTVILIAVVAVFALSIKPDRALERQLQLLPKARASYEAYRETLEELHSALAPLGAFSFYLAENRDTKEHEAFAENTLSGEAVLLEDFEPLSEAHGALLLSMLTLGGDYGEVTVDRREMTVNLEGYPPYTYMILVYAPGGGEPPENAAFAEKLENGWYIVADYFGR